MSDTSISLCLSMLLDESQRLFPENIGGGNNASQDLILVEQEGADSALLHVLH